MHILSTFLIRIVTAVFFIGMLGSVIVIVLSFVEDFQELFSSDESHLESPKGVHPAPPTT